MIPTKACVQCGGIFEKPRACGLPEWSGRRFCSQQCKAENQRGKVGGRLGKGGGPGSLGGKFLPCRICGKPTRYRGDENSQIFGLVNCGTNDCRAKSKSLRYKRAGATRRRQYHDGKWIPPKDNWRNAHCPEEEIIAPFLIDHGFERELPFTTKTHPRYYQLDFAHTDKLICIEIDGTSHDSETRKHRDARKDRILRERGWRVLRFPARSVRNDLDSVKLTIQSAIRN